MLIFNPAMCYVEQRRQASGGNGSAEDDGGPARSPPAKRTYVKNISPEEKILRKWVSSVWPDRGHIGTFYRLGGRAAAALAGPWTKHSWHKPKTINNVNCVPPVSRVAGITLYARYRWRPVSGSPLSVPSFVSAYPAVPNGRSPKGTVVGGEWLGSSRFMWPVSRCPGVPV